MKYSAYRDNKVEFHVSAAAAARNFWTDLFSMITFWANAREIWIF